VPTNSWIWYRVTLGSGSVPLSDIRPELALQPLNTAEPVPLVGLGIIGLSDGALFAYQPERELDPDTDHEVRFNRDLLLPSTLLSVSFRTGPGPDLEPPPVPELLGYEFISDYNQFDTCENGVTDYNDRATWRIDSAGMFNLLAGVDEIDEDELFVDPWVLSETEELILEGDIGPTSDMSMRLSAIDLAGNSSGWSDPHRALMPAAGCIDDGEGLRRASLPLAALLLLLRRGRCRRAARRARRSASWSPFVGPAGLALVAALLLPLAAPTTALAANQSARQRAALDRELAPIERGFAGVSLTAGTLQATWLLLQPPRVPFALQLSVVNTALWLPSVSSLVAIAGSRHSIRTSKTLGRARRAIKGAAITFGVLSMVTGTVALPGGLVLGLIYDPSLFFAVIAVPMSMLFLAATCNDIAARIRVSLTRARSAHRRPPPRLVGLGPSGLTVVF